MSDQRTILYVEDTDDVRLINSTYLRKNGYTVVEAADAATALKTLDSNTSIDVIISDIMMPGMDGYEFCKTIKSDENKKRIPVLFVSALSTLEEKLKGYSVGADDYITKPVELSELGAKVQTLVEFRTQNIKLASELKNTQNTTQQIMRYYSDIGIILEFYTNSLKANSFDQLARTIFDTLASLGLNCVIQILAVGRAINFSPEGAVSPLEANVIELGRKKERFFDFGARTLVNFENFSLLIKNMPVDNSERHGMLKDTLGTLGNAIDAKIQVLCADEVSRRKNEMVSTVQTALTEVDSMVENLRKRSLEASEAMVRRFENLFVTLGLSDSQENAIRGILNTNQNETQDAFDNSNVLTQRFREIELQLDAVIKMKQR